jgi:hypothetical protein
MKESVSESEDGIEASSNIEPLLSFMKMSGADACAPLLAIKAARAYDAAAWRACGGVTWLHIAWAAAEHVWLKTRRRRGAAWRTRHRGSRVTAARMRQRAKAYGCVTRS